MSSMIPNGSPDDEISSSSPVLCHSFCPETMICGVQTPFFLLFRPANSLCDGTTETTETIRPTPICPTMCASWALPPLRDRPSSKTPSRYAGQPRRHGSWDRIRSALEWRSPLLRRRRDRSADYEDGYPSQRKTGRAHTEFVWPPCPSRGTRSKRTEETGSQRGRGPCLRRTRR